MRIYKSSLLVFFILVSYQAIAQDRPIGYWRAHLNFNNVVGLTTDGNSIYTISKQSFFTKNTTTGNLTTYSKVEGMSDVSMACIGYDISTETVILGYQNSNIDLFKDNTFYNIPDLKNRAIPTIKSINSIYAEVGIAYLSTGVGILAIDLSKRDIKESYVFYRNTQMIPIIAMTADSANFYVIADSGLYRINKNSPQLENYLAWKIIDNKHSFNSMAMVNNEIFLSTPDSVFVMQHDTLHFVYQPKAVIRHLDPVKNGVWVTQYTDTNGKNWGVKIAANYQVIDSFKTNGKCRQTTESTDGTVWVADEFYGLSKKHNQFNDFSLEIPNGPSTPTGVDIYATNRDVIVAHGGYTDKDLANSNKFGFSELKNDQWQTYTYQHLYLYDSILDFTSVVKDPIDGTIYAGSFQNGLFILKPDGSSQLLNSPIIESSVANAGMYPVVGLAFDNDDNLWVSLFGSPHNLVEKTKDGKWIKYATGLSTAYPNTGGPLLIDDNGYIWFVGLSGCGVIVNHIDNSGNDNSKQLSVGKGSGNLPSNTTYCIAKDHNGDIWVGTANGIGIFNCGSQVLQGGCDAQTPIVQYDQFAGYLFQGENVRSIAVDGANRKWVGTDKGVWLLTPDASKYIYNFTQTNSPLPSNLIQKISIDPVTGDVFIGTQEGMVSYHGTSTEGGTSNTDVITYPNPIPTGYSGTIAIKGLVANGDVRITDITGQLVYRTTALGGQAVWNGKDYTGHRPQSGVYLIFVTNSDGSETYAGKMIFMQ